MCGIAGSWRLGNVGLRTHRVERALQLLAHRGPNDSGIECFETPNGHLALGHTRLAVIDLSAGGHQPMRSADGRFHLIFNGEIYNYRELREELKGTGLHFVSESDSEVLLQAWVHWGQACLPKLRGMFAFLVYDRVRQTITLVRDAFGIKPLYYRCDESGIHWASEVPALLALLDRPTGLNLQRSHDYLVLGAYDDREQTFFDGVTALLPGHVMTVSLEASAPEVRRWWEPKIIEHPKMGFEDAAEILREMFLNNVRLHLRSDVALGSALSGGVDSSAVVCAIRHLEPDMPIHTFSYVARGSRVNEEVWVDKVNAHVGAQSHKVALESVDLARDLDDMIRCQGEPFGSTSIYAQYRVYQLARECGVTVTLDGQGADELLAGYSGYPGARLHSLLEQGQLMSAAQFLRAWAKWPGRSSTHAVLSAVAGIVPAQWRGVLRSALRRGQMPSWMNAGCLRDSGVQSHLPSPALFQDERRGRRLVAALREALAGRGLAALLRHGDRNSMRWSIESRVPFLTTDMAEFLLSLPESYLLSPDGETKHVFRAAMRGIVPDAILDRRDKVGFETPEQDWLRQLQPQVQLWLEAADELPFLVAAEVRKEFIQIMEGRKPFSYQAWRLINFCRWWQLVGAQVAGSLR